MTIPAPLPYLPPPPGPFLNGDGEIQFHHREDEEQEFKLDLMALGYPNDPYSEFGHVEDVSLEDVSGVTISASIDVEYEGDYLVGTGTASTNGSILRNNLIDTVGVAVSSVADAFISYWIEITSGSADGDIRQVVNDNGAGTLSVTPNFSAQILTGVSYKLFKGYKGVTLSVSGKQGTATMVVTFANDVVRRIPLRFTARRIPNTSQIYR